MTAALDLDLDTAARALEASPDHRVLHRFVPRERYGAPIGPFYRQAAIVDLETTSLDETTAEVIEFAAVRFAYDRDGAASEVVHTYSALEQPRAPIAAKVTEKTGITDAMVAGKRIDDERVRAALDGCGLVIAHHARFDRPIAERRWPGLFSGFAWSCSVQEVDWFAFGVDGAKLVHVMEQGCRVFFDGHHAEIDCRAVLHALMTCERDGRTALADLLTSARQPWMRLYAEESPIKRKEAIKARRVGERRYRWYDGEDGRRKKAWWVDVRNAEEYRAELDWLCGEIYQSLTPTIKTEVLDGRVRYSARVVG